jgi:hypothetical protein
MSSINSSLILKIETLLISLVKSYWDNLIALENQGSSYEAGKRIEKMVMSRGGDNSSDDALPLPGFESEAWAKSAIEKLVRIRLIIFDLMGACVNLGSYNLCGKSCNVVETIGQSLERYFEENLRSMFIGGSEILTAASSQPINNATISQIQLARPSTMLVRLKTLIHAIQAPLSMIKVDVTTAIRKMMFNQCFAHSTVPPGSPVQPFSADGAGSNIKRRTSTFGEASSSSSDSVAWEVTNWFLALTNLLTVKGQTQMQQGGGIVWMPHMKAFCKLSKKGQKGIFKKQSNTEALYESENYHPSLQSTLFSETFLNHKELTSLIKIVGVQVVKHIDDALLRLVVEKIDVLKVFIINNQDALIHLSQDPSRITSVLSSLTDGLSTVFNSLLGLGIIFCVRDLLHGSLGECVSSLTSLHEITSIVENIFASPFAQTDSQAILQNLSYDFGNVNSIKVDRALKSALQNVFSNIGDNHHLSLLPIVSSLVFLAEDWKKSEYNSIYDVFTDNEHCIQVAIWKLHFCFFGRENFDDVLLSYPLQALRQENKSAETKSDATANSTQSTKPTSSATSIANPSFSSSSSTSIDAKSKKIVPPPPKSAGGPLPPSSVSFAPDVKLGDSQSSSKNKSDASIISNYTGRPVEITEKSTPSEIAKFDFDEHIGCFISLCGHSLLYIKSIPLEASSTGKMHPFEPLITLLESFVFTNRRMTNRLALDSRVPFALVHHSAMNSSIGKVRPEDPVDLSLTFSQSSHHILKDFDEEDLNAGVAAAPALSGGMSKK